MKKLALITGGGSGIGQALAQQLAKQSITVYIVGRRASKLETTKELAPEHIIPITADIATPQGRESVAEKLSGKPVHFLVHNAATAEPLKLISEIGLEEWQQHAAINLEAPLFLTQKLLPNLANPSRILNISSSLAHRALAGTGAYSISKAGLHMLYQIWNKELTSRGILAGSIQPGVVNTDMQVTLRSDEHFTSQAYFQSLKNESRLLSPNEVGKKLSWMLLEMEAGKFIERDWRIEDLVA